MIQNVHPATVSGTLIIPPSKSYSQRVLAAALLAQGDTLVHRLGDSDDERAALSIVQQAGVQVIPQGESSVLLRSKGLTNKDLVVNCGESGLSARLFTPILATSGGRVRIEGRGSLLRRPMQLFDELFQRLHVPFQSQQGFLPFELQGPLQPHSLTIDGSQSSQFITGLLFAFAATAGTDPIVIDIENPTSLPYIHMSVDVLRRFGIAVRMDKNRLYLQGSYTFQPCEIEIESDWSSASFWLVAAAIAGGVALVGLDPQSQQADRRIVDAVQAFGAQLRWQDGVLHVQAQSQRAFEFDARHCPDLFPPLAVLAACAPGKSVIRGVHRLASKESDRGLALQQELGKMGVSIQLKGDEMHIEGGSPLRGAVVHAHHDHRIAMALAIAALRADAPVQIEGAEAVAKSYPRFFEDWAQLCGDV